MILARLAVLTALLLAPWCTASAQSLNPKAGLVAKVTTGGTAVTALSTVANGCTITNPLTAGDEGIGAAEPLLIDPTGAAATAAANGTTIALPAGSSWSCIPYSGKAVSVNAATSGHKFSVVQW